MKEYEARIVDRTLQVKLEARGAVVMEEPKWCGKTTTAMQVAGSILRVDEPSKQESNIQMSQIAPERPLQGEALRLIDEWQIASKLWDATRYEVDSQGEVGQFIFTGSAVPIESEEITHSGTGRFTWLTMRPMSLYESGESSGETGLGDLFGKPERIVGSNSTDILQLTFLICRGGWPQAIGIREEAALSQAVDYYDAVVRSDINRTDQVNRDPERVRRLVRSLARNQGVQIVNTVPRDDIRMNGTASLSRDTAASYTTALKRILIVEDMLTWNPNLHSKTIIRTTDMRYYINPSIATVALGMGPNDLLNDLNTMGLLFETLCVRDLRVYAEAPDGAVSHYRDKDNLECDMVIHLRNGSYGLAEIKLRGDKLIEDGAKNLKTLADKIDTGRMPAPSFMMIVVGTGEFAYRREDGVHIVPITYLKN